MSKRNKEEKKSPGKARIGQRMLRISGILLLSLLLLSAVAWFYVRSQKEKVAVMALEYFNESYKGDIAYDAVSMDHWTGFSAPSIHFENLKVVDTSGMNHLRLQAARLELEVSIRNLLRGLVQIKSIRLHDGNLMLDNYTPLTPEEQQGLPSPTNTSEANNRITNDVLEKNTRLAISDFDIAIRHHVKDKLFKFRVDEFNSDISFSDESILARTYMDVNIETLGFNLAKGRFANGAQARGSFEAEFDLPGKQLTITSFPLELGPQVFETTARLNFSGAGTFDIVLENQRTQFDATMGLLTENIREKFAAIELEEPLHTQTQLKGSFVYRDNPRVQVAFQTTDNTAILDGAKHFTDLAFEGQFINRVLADDSGVKEDLKNFRIRLPQLQGRYRDIEFEISDMELASSPDAENAFRAIFRAGGSPESLNNFVANQHWNFQGGDFEMSATIEGEGLDIGSLMKTSRSNFSLKDTRIINNDNKVALPLADLTLSLADNSARLEGLRIALSARDELFIRAGFTNFSALFEEEPMERLQTDFTLSSENLVWEELLQLLEIAGSGGGADKPEVALQGLLQDIQRKYDPEIEIELGRFALGPFVLKDVVSGMHFGNEDLLILDKTSFSLPGGGMVMEGSLDLGRKDRIPLDARLDGSADVTVLNGILDTEDLNLDGGKFQIHAQLFGDLLRPEGILRNSSSTVVLRDIRAAYKPVDVVIPVTELSLELNKGNAALKALTLHLGDNDDLTFSGRIENLTALLFGGTGAVSSVLHVRSEKLIWEDYMKLFGSGTQKPESETPVDPESMREADRKFKASLRDIYSTMDPRITVDIGEFRYKDMQGFHDLRTAISFKDATTLQLEETQFLHNRKTAVRMQAEIDITDSRDTYAILDLEATGQPGELNDVLNNDTFLFEGGSFKVNAQIRGNMEELDSLIAHSDSELNIQDTFVIHKPSQVRIPIRVFQVAMKENTAALKAFEVELESGDRITLRGKVGHVSDLLLDVPLEQSRAYSEMHLESARVSYADFQALFALAGEDASPPGGSEAPRTALKPAIRDIYNKFRPSLTISLEEFELDALTLQNLNTGFYFEGKDHIYLEESGFDFHQGRVGLNAHLDISEPGKTFFSFGFTTDRIDLAKLLKAFDYFEMPSLQTAENIGGLITLNTEMEGEIDGEGLIIPESLTGRITFDLEDTELAGFQPLIDVGSKIFREERLQDIRFSPIKNTLTLADMRLDIPLMEIQSSAFELFLAGHLGFGEVPTNMWIGFPLNNLRERDVRNVPDKKGYIAAGKKVFIEAKSDPKKGMKYVLHLTPKQYYKERDMIEAYRREIREDRLRIRQYKRTGTYDDY